MPAVTKGDAYRETEAGADNAPGLARRRRPPLTTRAVIAIFSIVTVLIVGVTTFAVSYTTTLRTVDDIGRLYATAIVQAGRNDVEGYFDRASRNIKAIAKAGKRPWNVIPSDASTDLDVIRQMHQLQIHTMLTDPNQMHVISTIWDDGSVASIIRTSIPDLINIHGVNARPIPSGSRCCGIGITEELFINNMTVPATMLTPSYPYSDGRFDGYASMRSLVQFASFGMWLSVGLYEPSHVADRTYMLQLIHPIHNASGGYMAFVGLGITLSELTTMARQLDATANSEVFIFDGVPAILATTHAAPYSTFTPSTERNPALDPNCASSAFFADANETSFTIACRRRPQQFTEYPPLPALMEAHPRAARLPSGDQLIVKFGTDDGAHFAASAGLRNSERNFALTLLLVMPEADILGDVVRSRNTVIGIVAGICVTFAVLSALIVTRILAPLSDVSRRMRRTALLREESADVAWSRLAEIHDLQDAYLTMHTAISSFTRYVPRDVVKDLMDSGQLCEISMVPKQCTMLFVDIEGFTSMCERVPPQELSGLVETYFAHMSRIVMGHDGLIDKYIGDCIMAVWGAPFECPNAEVKAVLCAMCLERESRVAPLATEFDAAGEVLHIRVGVASGTVLAGNMGSADRMNYTVIGDPVNLAARLESMNKQFATRVMIDDVTASAVDGIVQLRLLLAIRVVGKEQAVRVYEPVGLKIDRGEAMEGVRTIDRCALEDAERRSGNDDRGSVMSGRSSAAGGAGPTRSRGRVDTTHLVDTAARLSDAPLLATAAQIRVAETHTAAVEAMMKRDFAGAIATAQEVAVAAAAVAASEPDATWAANQVPSDKLAALCERYLRDPPGPDFDGAWRSEEK
eukprot:CAMPEP_0174840600 /NCGR_PEP_ID=MMETSP1114-20130205/8778_1 /TAXON_ID=312471 /ORGANISM="Neobodo designis, Strain CCAP 1951/1" /LENGTH=859 /DNA_ID=CAMNT_0016074757 /DNA_START=220 /DNA_END=2799 /DNA_ORIENTATION=+